MFITNLISKITNFRVKIGDKLNILKIEIGQLDSLTTNDKSSLVLAVNEINRKAVVHDGKLTLTTGTGLNGSANFTANQSSNSIFDVSVASTHKLPTVAEWNALPTTNTITRLRGTSSGTYASGDLTLLAGSNVSIAQSGNNFTINATDTDTAYTAGNGLTLNSSNQFSIGRTTSGSGNVVSDVTITSTGISVVKGISAMTTSHLANLIDQNLNKVSSPTFNSIELSATAPFIDFHYNKSSADYTSRIVETGIGKLEAIVKDRFIVKYDGISSPLIDASRDGIIIGTNTHDRFESVELKTVFSSLYIDDEGLVYDPITKDSMANIRCNLIVDKNINNLKINGRGSLGTPLDALIGNRLTNYVFADVSDKNALGTFRVENNITKDGGIPVFAKWGASILVQSGDTMFTLSANPLSPEIYVSGGNTENNVRWNKKLAFSHNEFPLYAQAFYENSLRKLKENIKPFDKSGLELINSLDIVTFDRKDSEVKNKIGIIADDSADEVLSTKKDAVDLYNTIFIQAKAIQELSEEFVKLKDINNSLEERLNKIEKLLNL